MFRKALRPILKPIIGLSRRDFGQDIIRRMRLHPSVKRFSRSQIKTKSHDAQRPLVWQMDPPPEEADESYQDLLGLIRERPQSTEAHPTTTRFSTTAPKPQETTFTQRRAVAPKKPQILRSEISEDFPVKRASEPSSDSPEKSERGSELDLGQSTEIELAPPAVEPQGSPLPKVGTSTREKGKLKAREVVSKSETSPSARPNIKTDRGKPEQKKPAGVRPKVKPKLVARHPHPAVGEALKEGQRETSFQREQPRKTTQKEKSRAILQHRPAKQLASLDSRTRRVGRKPTKVDKRTTALVKPVQKIVIGKTIPVMRKLDRKWEGEPESSSPKDHQREVEKHHLEGEIGDLNLTLEVPFQQREKPVRGRRPPSVIEQSIVRPVVRQVLQRKPAPPPKGDLLDPESLWTRPTTRELTLVKPPSSPAQVDRRELDAGETQIFFGQSTKTTLPRQVQRSPAGEREEPSLVARAGEEATSQATTEAGAAKPEVDVEAVAREVYTILKRKLKVEQERIRGWGGFR